jgi:hypothetical protein
MNELTERPHRIDQKLSLFRHPIPKKAQNTNPEMRISFILVKTMSAEELFQCSSRPLYDKSLEETRKVGFASHRKSGAPSEHHET